MIKVVVNVGHTVRLPDDSVKTEYDAPFEISDVDFKALGPDGFQSVRPCEVTKVTVGSRNPKPIEVSEA